MNAKHTPGPWTADKSYNPDGLTEIRMNGIRIARILDTPAQFPTHGDPAANAALIAAAPDLLAALKGVGSASMCFCGEEDAPERKHRGPCKDARAAIARAEGVKP